MLTLFLSATVPPKTRNWIVGKVAWNRCAAVPSLALTKVCSVVAQRPSTAAQIIRSRPQRPPDTPIQLAVGFPAYSGVHRPFSSELIQKTRRRALSSGFSHLDEGTGAVHMVDVSKKCETLRVAVAEAKVFVSAELCERWAVDCDNLTRQQCSWEGDPVPGVGANTEIFPSRGASIPARRPKALWSTKGDIFAIAQVAGIMAAKRTSSLIPLCHNLPLSSVKISLTLNEAEPLADDAVTAAEREDELDSLAGDDDPAKHTHTQQRAFECRRPYVHIRSLVKTHSATGVEMEALTAVTIAGLTVYDMCKSVDKNITLGGVRLISKRGGKSDYGPLP